MVQVKNVEFSFEINSPLISTANPAYIELIWAGLATPKRVFGVLMWVFK